MVFAHHRAFRTVRLLRGVSHRSEASRGGVMNKEDTQQTDELQPQEDERSWNDWESDIIEYEQQEEY